MRELHRMNPLRTAWIANHVRARLGDSPAPVLDFGCGAGIATESLARAGFAMAGGAAASEALGGARLHADQAGLQVEYVQSTAAEMRTQERRFAAVTALEVIEHVPDQAAFIAGLAALLQPGGMLFVSTLNRSWRSFAFAKLGAEYLLRLLPVGTHDWKRFVRPDELARMGRLAGLHLTDLAGLQRDLSGSWRLGPDTSVNYIAAFALSRPAE